MTAPGKLSFASRRAVFSVVLRLLDAEPHQHFTQRTLAGLGVPQHRQALTMLRDLALVTAGGRLEEDVLSARHDPDRFRALLRDRLMRAWTAAGCSAADLDFLGRPNAGDLAARLDALPPIRTLTGESARSAARSTLRAWNDVLLHNRKWLQDELAALDARRDEEPPPAPPRTPPRVNGNGHAAGTAGDVLQRFVAAADVVSTPAHAVEGGQRIAIDFLPTGETLYAYVAADVPLTPAHLLRLAKQLESLAAEAAAT